MPDISITFDPPPSSLSALIDRLQTDMRKSLPDAVRLAAWYLAKSLSASTKASPKKRKLQKNQGRDRKHSPEYFPNYVTVYRQNGRQYRHFILAGEEETAPIRDIKRSGLAKDSWRWMIGKLGKPARSKNAPIAGAFAVTKIGDESNPAWVLENKLRYIESAVRTSGKRAIQDAFARAARNGNKAIGRRIAKALEKAKA